MINDSLIDYKPFSSEKKKKKFLHISEIKPRDQRLLQEMVRHKRPHTENYEDSWGYIIQATRYGGFKCYDPETGSLIFFGRKSETDPTLVVPNFFATPSYLASIVKKVKNELGAPQVILKNINYKEITKFFLHGFRPYNENEQWDQLAQFDDQTYPQQLVDIRKVIEHKGDAYHNLKTALNKKPNVYMRPYRENDKKDVLAIFAEKDGNKKNGMYYESHAMYPASDIEKFVIADVATDKIVGFTATSDITKNTIAFVALLFSPRVRGISIWAAYQTLLLMHQKGYQKVNFGGCETEGSYNFIKRIFRPIDEIKKTHLVFESTVPFTK